MPLAQGLPGYSHRSCRCGYSYSSQRPCEVQGHACLSELQPDLWDQILHSPPHVTARHTWKRCHVGAWGGGGRPPTASVIGFRAVGQSYCPGDQPTSNQNPSYTSRSLWRKPNWSIPHYVRFPSLAQCKCNALCTGATPRHCIPGWPGSWGWRENCNDSHWWWPDKAGGPRKYAAWQTACPPPLKGLRSSSLDF